MKKTMQMVAVTFAAVCWCAQAATNTVYNDTREVAGIMMNPVQQLIYAVTNAANGDTVLIKSGTYTFEDGEYSAIVEGVKNLLQPLASDLSIVGDIDTSRKDWTLGDEPVVIDGNGKGRLFYFQEGGCSLRNVAVTGGSASTFPLALGRWTSTYRAVFTNCIVRGISGTSNDASYYILFQDCLYQGNSAYFRADSGAYGCDFFGNTGGIHFTKAYGCRFAYNNTGLELFSMDDESVLSDCSFVANTNSQCTVRCRDFDKVFEKCDFIGNSAACCMFFANTVGKTNSSVVSGCKFIDNNAAVLMMNDASGSRPLNGTITMTNCTASSNVSGQNCGASSGVRGIVIGNVNAIGKCSIFDSTFSNNTKNATGYGIRVVSGVRAVRCKFYADANVLSGYTQEWGKYNETAGQSILEDCDISSGELRDCVVDRCDIHDVTNKAYSIFKDYMRVTNTLIRCCVTGDRANGLGGFYSDINTLDAEFVNCTIVSNDMLILDIGWTHEGDNTCRFVNCLFNENRYGEIISDITMSNTTKSQNNWDNNLVGFSTTYYGAFSAYGRINQSRFDAKTGENLLDLCANPSFAKNRYRGTPYWSLLLNSPLLGKGDPLGFTDSDLDLAGRPRLKDGHIDIGCYQCWVNPPGMMLIIK